MLVGLADLGGEIDGVGVGGGHRLGAAELNAEEENLGNARVTRV